MFVQKYIRFNYFMSEIQMLQTFPTVNHVMHHYRLNYADNLVL